MNALIEQAISRMGYNTTEHQEWLDWVNQPCDSVGECDRCHDDGALWQLPLELDNEPDADWMYCSRCFQTIVSR